MRNKNKWGSGWPKHCTSYDSFVYVDQNIVGKTCHGHFRRVDFPKTRMFFTWYVQLFEVSRQPWLRRSKTFDSTGRIDSLVCSFLGRLLVQICALELRSFSCILWVFYPVPPSSWIFLLASQLWHLLHPSVIGWEYRLDLPLSSALALLNTWKCFSCLCFSSGLLFWSSMHACEELDCAK